MCHRTCFIYGCRHPDSYTKWHDCHSNSRHHKDREYTKLLPLCPSCQIREESLYLSEISHQAQYGDDDTGHTGHTSDSGLSGHSYYTHGYSYDEVHVNVRHRGGRRGGRSRVRVRVRG